MIIYIVLSIVVIIAILFMWLHTHARHQEALISKYMLSIELVEHETTIDRLLGYTSNYNEMLSKHKDQHKKSMLTIENQKREIQKLETDVRVVDRVSSTTLVDISTYHEYLSSIVNNYGGYGVQDEGKLFDIKKFLDEMDDRYGFVLAKELLTLENSREVKTV